MVPHAACDHAGRVVIEHRRSLRANQSRILFIFPEAGRFLFLLGDCFLFSYLLDYIVKLELDLNRLVGCGKH
jgi:hypothetical protein